MVCAMADVEPQAPPVATAVRAKKPQRSGIVIDPVVIGVGSGVALVGLAVLALFLWMVPTAAARESVSACRGLRGYEELNPALCPNGQPCNVPQPEKDFTALDITGKPVKLSDFRGKVVLLNFWASWCNVCKTEKPSLAAMASEMGSDDFVVLTLVSDHNWTDVILALMTALAPNAEQPARGPNGEVPMPQLKAAFEKAFPKGVPFKAFLDPPQGDDNLGPITQSWGIHAVPESALIDRQGRLRAYFVNKRDWESPVAQTCLRSVIDE